MPEKIYILSDNNQVAFKKFLLSYIRKKFPFITKIEFEDLPSYDSVNKYFINFLVKVYIDYNYIINSERAMRHISKESLDEMAEKKLPISDWNMRLLLSFSEWDFRVKILELMSYITAENRADYYPEGDVTFLIDPATYVP